MQRNKSRKQSDFLQERKKYNGFIGPKTVCCVWVEVWSGVNLRAENVSAKTAQHQQSLLKGFRSENKLLFIIERFVFSWVFNDHSVLDCWLSDAAIAQLCPELSDFFFVLTVNSVSLLGAFSKSCSGSAYHLWLLIQKSFLF